MAESITLPHQRPVSWLKVNLEESRQLLKRYWWLLLGYTLLLITLVYWRLPGLITDHRHSIAEWYLDLDHAYIWPIFFNPLKLFMLATAAGWALLIWGNSSPEQRSSSWSLPMSRLTHHSARIIPGALLLLIIYLITLYTGVVVTAAYAEVRGLITGFLPSLPFLALGLSLLNLYLFTSLLALRVKQPYRPVFLYLPLAVLILFGAQLLLDMPAVNTLLGPLLPPYGLLGGLGISLWDGSGTTLEPVLWAPLLWFGIITVSLYFIASRHQET